MDSTGIDSAIEQLSKLLGLPHLTFHMKQKIQTLQLDLQFVKLFICCLAKWKSADDNIEASKLEAAANIKGLYNSGYLAIIGRDFKSWDRLSSILLEKVELFKPEIRKTSLVLFDLSSQFISSSSISRADEILQFIDYTLMCLNDLFSLIADKIIVPVQKQIEAVEKKLRFSRIFVEFVAKRGSTNDSKMEDFFIHFQDWAKNSACLSLLYWVDGMDEYMVHKMNIMLLKFMPCNPAIAEMYIELLKFSETSPSDSFLMGEIVCMFVDSLLENVVVSLKDDFATLREGLVFLIAFLVDPTKESATETGNVIDSLVKSLISSLYIYQTEDYTSKKRNDLVHDLIEKIEKVKVEVGELYTCMPNLLEPNFPKTNGMGFMDYLTQNLSDTMNCKPNFIPFAEHKVMAVHVELVRFRSFLQDTVNLQRDDEELRALQTRIVNLAYKVEHVIESCSVVNIPIWNHIVCFSNILEEIKAVQTEIAKIEKEYNIGNQSVETSSKLVHPSRANTLKTDDIVVGFKNEASQVIGMLTGGSKRLEIISIVGMPGVGKTTLAKKVYSSITSNFHKHAWCFVSQVYTSRDLLLSILKRVSDDGIDDVQISKMSSEDIGDRLRKCLKRQKYLLVMDDIWNVEAWNIVKQSFPDDQNESRILFTTQNKNLILDVDRNSRNYPLSPLIGDKSWDFLREKLFGEDDCCDEQLSVIGKEIVRYCEGLPLAITVIAGLLAKEKENVEWWKLVEASLSSKSTSEGYMGTLELSYNYLMDSLKPCYLYFGAFRKGEVITAKKLILLWNAEGFIKKSEMRSFEAVAKEYLRELIDRSLVIVSKRSSNGGIKACRVHDLLHKFCSEKAKEENFLHVVQRSEDSHYVSNPVKYDQYRLCIHTEWETFKTKSDCSGVRSLLFFCDTIRRQNSHYRYPSLDTSGFFNSFKLLKVLNLERICLNCPFPDEIISMVHLRYLGIWGSITEVPALITNLSNLETFIVKGMESFINLPDTIWKMKSLKNVDVSEMAVISSGDYEGEETYNIETFSSLSLSHGGDVEKLLRRLKKLQKLRCIFAESKRYRRKGIQFPSLAALENLESLKMSTDGSHEQVFYSWMRIQFQAFNFPSNLKKLTLYDFGLPWSAISTIGKLPNLEVLKMRQQAFRGQIWNAEDEQFSNLKFLELSHLDFVLWKASSDSFPRLERLVMGDCYELEAIPLSFADIDHLTVIQLRRCNYDVEDSARQILKEQRNVGNEELEVLLLN